MQPSVVAHYVLDIMNQGSHISKRYYKSRIPKGAHTLECNRIRVNPTGRCTTTQLPALARAATQLSRNSERRESGASYSLGNTHRGARHRVTTAPVTKRWQTVKQPSPPVQVGTTQRTWKRPTQLQRVNITSVQRTTLGLPPSGAAVQAYLAPAQPPPPAGLASSPTCIKCLYLSGTQPVP
jgi:hypothetical protein